MVVIIDWLEPSKSKKKNAVLPLLAATVLAKRGRDNLEKNVPVLSDVFTMNNVVRGLNAQVTFNEEDNTVVVDARENCLRKRLYKYVSRCGLLSLSWVLSWHAMAMPKFPCLEAVRLGVVRLTST